MTTEDTNTTAAGGSQLVRGVGRLEPERDQVGTRLRPVCWYCDREIHPLDDMHHLWCHGGNP